MSNNRKKSLVPLFGVAFIVAILSTGIFYGLFVGKLNSASTSQAGAGKVLLAARSLPAGAVLKTQDLKEVAWGKPPMPAGAVTSLSEATGQTLVGPLAENEMLMRIRLASKTGGPADSASMGIPEGMRAISLQVHDSEGVIAMLKPGHRIDIQVVTPPGFHSEAQLRTALENVPVLAIPNPKEMLGVRGGAHIVTVLAAPKEAAMLGLADSTAKIRIALRNPIDQKKENLSSLSLGTASSPASQSAEPAQHIQLTVRLAGASRTAIEDLVSQLDGGSAKTGLWQVAAFRPQAAIDAALERLEQTRSLEVLHQSRVLAVPRRIVIESGAQWSVSEPSSGCGLRIRFAPWIQSSGRLLVRVHPEITTPGNNSVNRRRMETEIELADGQSFLVRGWAAPAEYPLLWEKLFPGRATGGSQREFLVLVTTKLVRRPSSTTD